MKRFIRTLGAARIPVPRSAWAAVMGLAGALPMAAAAQPPPVAWAAYADLVRQALPDWLAEDTAPNRRLIAFIDRLRPAPNSPTPPLELKIWIDANGVVSQAAFIGAAEADETPNLQASLVGRRVDSARQRTCVGRSAWPSKWLRFRPSCIRPRPPIPDDRACSVQYRKQSGPRRCFPSSRAGNHICAMPGLPSRFCLAAGPAVLQGLQRPSTRVARLRPRALATANRVVALGLRWPRSIIPM